MKSNADIMFDERRGSHRKAALRAKVDCLRRWSSELQRERKRTFFAFRSSTSDQLRTKTNVWMYTYYILHYIL